MGACQRWKGSIFPPDPKKSIWDNCESAMFRNLPVTDKRIQKMGLSCKLDHKWGPGKDENVEFTPLDPKKSVWDNYDTLWVQKVAQGDIGIPKMCLSGKSDHKWGPGRDGKAGFSPQDPKKSIWDNSVSAMVQKLPVGDIGIPKICLIPKLDHNLRPDTLICFRNPQQEKSLFTFLAIKSTIFNIFQKKIFA